MQLPSVFRLVNPISVEDTDHAPSVWNFQTATQTQLPVWFGLPVNQISTMARRAALVSFCDLGLVHRRIMAFAFGFWLW
jgi:hypothetical protein